MVDCFTARAVLRHDTVKVPKLPPHGCLVYRCARQSLGTLTEPGRIDLLKRDCRSGMCGLRGLPGRRPTKAITMKRYSWGLNPELNGHCVDEPCTRCFDVCPAREVPISRIERTFFGRVAGEDGLPPELGVIRNVYSGHATDPEVHGASVSGGVVSSILIHALEKGTIDGAVLAGYDTEQGWIATAKVATDRAGVLACAGSKYQPHAQLLGLDEAIRMGLKKIAITCTPCHAVAVRKMMMDEAFADIGSRIALVISNICGAHWSTHGTEWLICKKMGLRLEDVAGITYRARPFPGDFHVRLRDGTVRVAPFVNHFLAAGAVHPEECRYCLEKVALSGDIVVGDTWHHRGSARACSPAIRRRMPTATRPSPAPCVGPRWSSCAASAARPLWIRPWRISASGSSTTAMRRASSSCATSRCLASPSTTAR